MVRKYQAEANTCLGVNKNQAEVNWQYLMAHKYPVEANKCLNTSPSERRKHSKTTTPSRTRRNRSVRRQIMFALRAASGLAQAKCWVLRCKNDTWAAYDTAKMADGTTLTCRQPAPRRIGEDITQRGWHKWEINDLASPTDDGLEAD